MNYVLGFICFHLFLCQCHICDHPEKSREISALMFPISVYSTIRRSQDQRHPLISKQEKTQPLTLSFFSYLIIQSVDFLHFLEKYRKLLRGIGKKFSEIAQNTSSGQNVSLGVLFLMACLVNQCLPPSFFFLLILGVQYQGETKQEYQVKISQQIIIQIIIVSLCYVCNNHNSRKHLRTCRGNITCGSFILFIN